MQDLKWYESTKGPELSLTFKSIVGLLLPVLKELTGFELENQMVDNIIDAGMIVGFGIIALVGYVRSKKAMVEKMGAMQNEIERLGGEQE